MENKNENPGELNGNQVQGQQCPEENRITFAEKPSDERAMHVNKNISNMKVRDLSKYENCMVFAMSVFDGNSFVLSVNWDIDDYHEILTMLTYDKVSLSKLKEYMETGCTYQNLSGDSGCLLCELLENRVDMYCDISVGDKSGFLHVWLKESGMITVDQFDIKMLP